MKKLVSPAVLSSILGVPVRELRREAEEGRIPHVRIGEQGLLFDLEAVTRILLGRAGTADVGPVHIRDVLRTDFPELRGEDAGGQQ